MTEEKSPRDKVDRHPRSAPAASGSLRRWQIIRAQMHEHREPCFGTDLRYLCTNRKCPVRRECRALRADHRF